MICMCIENKTINSRYYHLTINKLYNILREDMLRITIINDIGFKFSYPRCLFRTNDVYENYCESIGIL